jgi:hypothetical protein
MITTQTGLVLVAVLALAGTAAGTEPGARVTALRQIDARFTTTGHEADLPTPNLKLKQDWHERNYWDKAAAIFALVDAGAAPAGRTEEANRLLRYAMLGKWTLSGADQIEADSGIWMHRSRTLGLRVYVLYHDRLDNDIRAEFERRLDWLAREPYTRLSENIKLTNNSSYFLAHELRGATDRETYRLVRQWLVNYLRRHRDSGTEEWGSSYNAWTLVAILNLAEFAQDADVRRLATEVIDYDIARMLTMSVDGNFCSGAVRRYPFFTHGGYIEPQTQWAWLLFKGTPASDELWADFALSRYTPPAGYAGIGASATYEAFFTDAAGPRNLWRHYFYRDGRAGIATMRAVGAGEFVQPSGGTHDIVGCFVQSGKNPRHHVVPFGYLPKDGPKKMRNPTERYFGYKNVAFTQHGGHVNAVWAKGVVADVPIRLFYYKDFRCVIRDGWAFLTDGAIHVAWAPTIGDPVRDPDSAEFSDPQKHGGWLRSTHTPGPGGEVAVIEVADAASSGSFEAFQQAILERNPRPRWSVEGIRYHTIDGTLLEFSSESIRLNGVVYDAADHPRAQSPWLQGDTVTYMTGAVGAE